MTRDPNKIAAIGLIAFLLALLSLATTETANRNDDLANGKHKKPLVESERNASKRVLRALRQGQSVDINRASAADLELLPGIGPKLAQRIIADRTNNGSYRDVKDLIRVYGIGPMTLSRIEPLVTTLDDKTKIDKNK